MTNRKPIAIETLTVKPYDLLENQWMLLACGDFKTGHFNTMTIAWGSFGVMWNRPFVLIAVRPTRYTYEFTNQYDDFTVTAFADEYRNDLSILGSKSGRDGDKLAETRLTPIASEKIASPGFAEAELIIECKKMFWHDFDPKQFINAEIEKQYNSNDYHRVYYGEILNISGIAKYAS